MNLSDEELDRYARHIVLPQVGGFGQRRLKETRVAVVGAGPIGLAAIMTAQLFSPARIIAIVSYRTHRSTPSVLVSNHTKLSTV